MKQHLICIVNCTANQEVGILKIWICEVLLNPENAGSSRWFCSFSVETAVWQGRRLVLVGHPTQDLAFSVKCRQ